MVGLISTLPTRNWNIRDRIIKYPDFIISTLPTRNWNKPIPDGVIPERKISTLPTRNWNQKRGGLVILKKGGKFPHYLQGIETLNAHWYLLILCCISTLPTRNWNLSGKRFFKITFKFPHYLQGIETWFYYQNRKFYNYFHTTYKELKLFPSLKSKFSNKISTLPTRNWNLKMFFACRGQIWISTLPTRNWNGW